MPTAPMPGAVATAAMVSRAVKRAGLSGGGPSLKADHYFAFFALPLPPWAAAFSTLRVMYHCWLMDSRLFVVQ